MLEPFRSADPHREAAVTVPVVQAPTPLPENDSWYGHIEGVLATTWATGTEYGGAVATGAVDLAGRAATGASETATSAFTYAGQTLDGLGRVGGSVIDLAVINPAMIATRSAATMADVAIVKPARAISRFVLIALAIVCGSGVAISGFAALALYFYHAGGGSSAGAPTIIVVPGGSVSAETGQVVTQQSRQKSIMPVRAAAGE